MDRNKKYFWHPMTDTRESNEETVVIVKGDGNYIYDDKGNRLLDGVGGLWCVNAGHNRKEIKEAIIVQMDELEYYQLFTNIAHPKAYELAEKIIELTKEEDMAKVFFTSGGSDSVDTALKISRQYWEAVNKPKKKKFISLQRSYHGTHFGGISVAGSDIYRNFFGPVLQDCIFVDSPHLLINPWNCDNPDKLTELCINQLEETIKQNGPENIAAFIAEPVQGAGGIIVPPSNYWKEVRRICDKYDILLIADEVVTGFGRSGSMFGSRGWGVKPDVMIFAKGLSSGYIPMGATVFNTKIASGIENATNGANIIKHGYTYSGHPLACSAALAALDIVVKEDLPGNARVVGAYLLDKLKTLQEKYDIITDVRGKGLMIAIDFEVKGETDISKTTKKVRYVADYAIKKGVLLRDEEKTIIISPSLTFTKEDADILFNAISEGFEDLYKNQ